MSKEVQMTFRVEPELRSEFADAALQENRELMRAYVNQSRERVSGPVNTAISATEKRRREAAVNFARASVGLEGFTPSEAADTGARQFIQGDIQLADFVQVKVNAR